MEHYQGCKDCRGALQRCADNNYIKQDLAWTLQVNGSDLGIVATKEAREMVEERCRVAMEGVSGMSESQQLRKERCNRGRIQPRMVGCG